MTELTEMVYKRLCRSCRLMISDIDGSCSRCGEAFADSAALTLAPHPVAAAHSPVESVPASPAA
jgi:predicted amidophosphoribosyltransferase